MSGRKTRDKVLLRLSSERVRWDQVEGGGKQGLGAMEMGMDRCETRNQRPWEVEVSLLAAFRADMAELQRGLPERVSILQKIIQSR